MQSPKFPLQTFESLLPDGTSLGNLHWTFGTNLTSIEYLLRTGKVPMWRTHLFNGSGLRNQKLGRYEPIYGYTVQSFNHAWKLGGDKLATWLSTEVKKYCELFAKYPKIKWYVSPTLEHELSEDAFENQKKVIEAACPEALIVNNPLDPNFQVGGTLLETHGSAPLEAAKCIWSADGLDATETDISRHLSLHKVCDVTYIWSRIYNGRHPADWEDPRERTAWPSWEQMEEVLLYQKPLPKLPEGKPRGCESIYPLDSSHVWYPWATDTDVKNEHANRPAWVTNFKGKKVNILDSVGNVLGTLNYFAIVGISKFSYYINELHAIDLVHLGERTAGNPYIYVQEGRNCFGPHHPVYRGGIYKE